MGILRWFGRGLRAAPRDVVAMWVASRNPATPRGAQLVALLAALYAVSPIDLLPDVVPLLGWADDLLVVPTLLAFATRMVPPPVMAHARARADVLVGRPGRWLRWMLVGVLWLVALAALGVWWWRH